MTLRITLILLTVISVVADTMILPFYPHFFEKEFGINSSMYVGLYIAACSFTVMVTFPLWALVAKRVHEMHLWVVTQAFSAFFGYMTFCSESLIEFWVFSQLMLVCKASYLLIYPFFLRLEEQYKHLGVVGLFAFLMHFSAIGGAVLGGLVLDLYNPRDIYLIMIASDIIQILVCLYLIYKCKFQWKREKLEGVEHKTHYIKKHVIYIGLTFLLLYFSSFLMRPYFTRLWEVLTQNDNEFISGIVYSLPAWVALAGIFINRRLDGKIKHFPIIISSFFLACLGSALQTVESATLVILGRCILGWAAFQLTVRLELLIFSLGKESDYAFDFSIVSIFQNIGVITASFAVGHLVDTYSLTMPFYVAAAGFIMTLLVFYCLLAQNTRESESNHA